MNYDDRLADHDSIDDLIDAADEIVREMAGQHYDECYDECLCGMCADDTPISGEWGPWMGKKREYDGLVEAVEGRLRARGEPPHWVASHLSGLYLEAFTAAAVDPEDCAVCTREIVGDDGGCGHTMHGYDCPVR